MPQFLDEYRVKLINQILFSASEGEVKRCCDNIPNELAKHKIQAEVALLFAEKLIGELKLFNPIDKGLQQWLNIQMARIHLDHIKQKLERDQINIRIK